MLKAFTLLFLVAIASFVVTEEAYFKFRYYRRQGEFVFKLTDSATIQQARRILSGDEQSAIHVMGRIKKQGAYYNPQRTYTLDPSSVIFVSQAIEVCDDSLEYLEDHLDEASGAFLPGCYWCPWGSELTGEVVPNSAFEALFFQKYYVLD